jgi:hypothetical protein
VVDITYEKENNGDTELVGSFRHGAKNYIDKVIISCGPGCSILASAPKLEKNIADNRGGRPSNACATNPGDTKGKVHCLTIRYLDFCEDLVFKLVDISKGCDATCWRCKLVNFT